MKQVSQCQVSYHCSVGEGRSKCISLHLLYCALLYSFLFESVQTALHVFSAGIKISVWTAAARSTSWLSRPGMCVSYSLTLHSAEDWLCHSPQVLVCPGKAADMFMKDMFAVLFWCAFVNCQGGCMLGKIGCYLGRWHQGWPKGKAAILLYLTITEVKLCPCFRVENSPQNQVSST